MADYTYGQSLAPQKTSNVGPRLAFAGHALQLAGGLGSMFSESARRKKEVEDENKAIARANLISVLSGQAQQPMMRYRGPNLTEQVSKGASVVGKVLSSYGQYVDESKTREQTQRMQGLKLRAAEYDEARNMGKNYYSQTMNPTLDTDTDEINAKITELGITPKKFSVLNLSDKIREQFATIDKDSLYDETGTYVGSDLTGDLSVTNNNPGNMRPLVAGVIPAHLAEKGITATGIDENNYLIFKTAADGLAALRHDIGVKYRDSKVITLSDFAKKYIGGQQPGTIENEDPEGTVKGLSNYTTLLGVNENTPLHAIDKEELLTALVINESGTDSAVHFGLNVANKPRVSDRYDNISLRRQQAYMDYTKVQLALKGINPENRGEELIQHWESLPENTGKTMSPQFRSYFTEGITEAVTAEKDRQLQDYLHTAAMSFNEADRELRLQQLTSNKKLTEAQHVIQRTANYADNDQRKLDARNKWTNEVSKRIENSTQLKNLNTFDESYVRFSGALGTLRSKAAAYKAEHGVDPTLKQLKSIFGTVALDITLVNMFQRLIDPATVREGDVSLWMARGGGVAATWETFIDNTFGDGASLSADTLDNMASIAKGMRDGLAVRALARTMYDVNHVIEQTKHLDKGLSSPLGTYEFLLENARSHINQFADLSGGKLTIENLAKSSLNIQRNEDGTPALIPFPNIEGGNVQYIEHEDDAALIRHLASQLSQSSYLPESNYGLNLGLSPTEFKQNSKLHNEEWIEDYSEYYRTDDQIRAAIRENKDRDKKGFVLDVVDAIREMEWLAKDPFASGVSESGRPTSIPLSYRTGDVREPKPRRFPIGRRSLRYGQEQ